MNRKSEQLPVVSIIIPTYQAASTLELCLKSIFNQKYPREMMEIIVVDGGSTDGTKEIASCYNIKIIHNPQRVQDGPNGGKALGVKHSRGDILCFLDSDNIICGEDWLMKMIRPLLEDDRIAICESSRILDEKDPAINRFCSYYVLETSERDPFIPFRRVSDRTMENRLPSYYTYRAINDLPCLANGSTIRRKMLELAGGYDYDMDVVFRLAAMGYTLFAQSICGGIHHLYVLSLKEFIVKAINRARIFLLRQSRIKALPNFLFRGRKLDFLLAVVEAFIPFRKLLIAIQKMHASRDKAWLYYPLLSFLTAIVYLVVFSIYRRKP